MSQWVVSKALRRVGVDGERKGARESSMIHSLIPNLNFSSLKSLLLNGR